MPVKKKSGKSKSGGKKKGAKKVKKSKEEQAKEKLEKAAAAFEAADDLHSAFVARMDKWMTDNLMHELLISFADLIWMVMVACLMRNSMLECEI